MKFGPLGVDAALTAAVLAVFGATSAVGLGATGFTLRPRSTETAQASGGASLIPARTLKISCPSPALGGRFPAAVYLPAGYTGTGPALPVVYFLHGLPAGPQTYTGNEFVARAVALDQDPAIVVAPQGARSRDSDREYLDWSSSENWPAAITDDLTSCIDHRFNTIASRSGRVLVGESAGGYGALNIGLRNLATFGAVEAWSGYFDATDPSGNQVLKLGSATARAAAQVLRGAALASQLGRFPSLIGFYVGRADDRFADDNTSFNRSLTSSGIPHVFRTYPGGHALSLWQSQAPGWLRMALVYLASGRRIAP